jgi:hypothetical protein
VPTKQLQIAELAKPEGARWRGKVHSIYAAKSSPEEPSALIGLVTDTAAGYVQLNSCRRSRLFSAMTDLISLIPARRKSLRFQEITMHKLISHLFSNLTSK